MVLNSGAPSAQDEAELILLAVKGDTEAFGALYTRHLDVIYRYVYFRIGNVAEAEDLTEEVFVKAWEALPRYRPGAYPFKAWLYRIAHNLTVDYHRKAQHLDLPDENSHHLAAPAYSAEDIVERQQGLSALAAALRKLDDEEQAVVILRFIQGLSHQEVAVMLGKSSQASRVIQHRALAKLSRILQSEGQRS